MKAKRKDRRKKEREENERRNRNGMVSWLVMVSVLVGSRVRYLEASA